MAWLNEANLDHIGVDLVMVAGEVVYEGGRFTRVERAAALRELHESLQHALANDEVERRQLSKALPPHVRRFYAGYFDPEPAPALRRCRCQTGKSVSTRSLLENALTVRNGA